MRFLAKFLERWKLYLIPVVLIPILATIYGQHKLSVYESSAYVRVEHAAVIGNTSIGGINGNSYNTPAQNAVDAITELLQSRTFLIRVAQHSDLAKQYDLNNSRADQDVVVSRLQQEATVAPSTVGQETFNVVVDDKSAVLAQQLVRSLISQFTDDIKQRELNGYAQEAAIVQEQIIQTQGQIAQDLAHISQYKATHPGVTDTTPDPTYQIYQDALTQDAATLKSENGQRDTLSQEKAAIENGTLNVFTVLDAPRQPLKPTLKLKKLIIYPGGGLALALALIALIVGLQTALDRGVYTQQDIRSLLEELDMDIASIEAVPVLHGIGDRVRDEDEGATYSGVLVPVLTVLPQLSSEEMSHELRRAVGIGADE